MKNLIITLTGKKTLLKNWVGDDNNFDIHILYYSDEGKVYFDLLKQGHKVEKVKGEKWFCIQQYINQNPQLLETYDTFWFPDDDLFIDNESINKLFNIHNKYNLFLSQPAAIGYTSHEITKPQNCKLRYTNFVEIMCPMMSKETLKILLNSFNLTESGWGLDLLWPKLLNYPKNKIAIIDEVVIIHTKPVGQNYQNRFSVSPMDELNMIRNRYSVNFNFEENSRIL